MRLRLKTTLWRHQSKLLIRRQFPKVCHHIKLKLQKKQKPGTKLQLVTDETEIQTKD